MLQRAEAELAECGAVRYADEAARELDDWGGASRDRGVAPRWATRGSRPGSSRSPGL